MDMLLPDGLLLLVFCEQDLRARDLVALRCTNRRLRDLDLRHSVLLSLAGHTDGWRVTARDKAEESDPLRLLDTLERRLAPGRLVSAGGRHSIAGIQTFGANDSDQLGLGDSSVPHEQELREGVANGHPTPVKLDRGRVVGCVAAGSECCAVVTTEGQLFSWGWCGAGQVLHESSYPPDLERGTIGEEDDSQEIVVSAPLMFPALSNRTLQPAARAAGPEVISAAVLGTGSTVVLTAKGRVFQWGQDLVATGGTGAPWEGTPEGDQDALLGSVRQVTGELRELDKHRVVDFATKSNFSAAVTTEGWLFVWGEVEADEPAGRCFGKVVESDAVPKMGWGHDNPDEAFTDVFNQWVDHVLDADGNPLPPNGTLSASPCLWGVEEVCTWLATVEGVTPEMIAVFRDAEVDGKSLHDNMLQNPELMSTNIRLQKVLRAFRQTLKIHLKHDGFLRPIFRQFNELQAKPSKNNLRAPPIRFVSCGERHIAAVTRDGGRLLTAGSGDFGQLGLARLDYERPARQEAGAILMHGVTHRESSRLCQVKGDLTDKTIARVSCGDLFTVAVTDQGELFSWGHGGHGRLGHGSCFSATECCWYPRRVSTFSELVVTSRESQWQWCPRPIIVEVACGWTHSLAVSDSGEVFSWGQGDNGQLGHTQRSQQNGYEPHADRLIPSKIADLRDGITTSWYRDFPDSDI